MQALIYAAHDTLTMCDLPTPLPGSGEVLIKVAACGICGSELESVRSRSPRRPPPLVFGHEFCGTVAGLGEGVDGWRSGQRAVVSPVVWCQTCGHCRAGREHLCVRRQIFGMHRQGAFAEYIAVPVRCLLPWSDGVAPEAAALTEPLGNAVHVVELVRDLHPANALVLGAGPIGLMCQQALQVLLGIPVLVSDVDDGRLRTAARMGAAGTINARSGDPVAVARDFSDGMGVDVVVDAAGLGITKRQSIAASRAGGAIVWLGLADDRVEIDTYGITLDDDVRSARSDGSARRPPDRHLVVRVRSARRRGQAVPAHAQRRRHQRHHPAMTFTTVITDHGFPNIDAEARIIAAAGGTVSVTQCRTALDVVAAAAAADALLVQWAPIDAAAMKALRNCRVIVRYGIGTDNIDLAAARERGIAVCNVPDYGIDEVADHAVSMALALGRQLPAPAREPGRCCRSNRCRPIVT